MGGGAFARSVRGGTVGCSPPDGVVARLAQKVVASANVSGNSVQRMLRIVDGQRPSLNIATRTHRASIAIDTVHFPCQRQRHPTSLIAHERLYVAASMCIDLSRQQ